MDKQFIEGWTGPEILDGEIIPARHFSGQGADAFFSTRHGAPTRDEILRRLGRISESPYMPVQKHTATVLEVRPETPPGRVADAVFTRDPNRFIGVVVADCVPILILDPVQKAVAAVHAGWRGTAGGILADTIDRMMSVYGSRPADLRVSVGPSIRSCCYNVGVEVADAVSAASASPGKPIEEFAHQREGKLYLDLAGANRYQAIRRGVPPERIEVVEACTCCQAERFHSFRRDGTGAGRQGAFIRLRPDRPTQDDSDEKERGRGKR